jgi:hypothetical protein
MFRKWREIVSPTNTFLKFQSISITDSRNVFMKIIRWLNGDVFGRDKFWWGMNEKVCKWCDEECVGKWKSYVRSRQPFDKEKIVFISFELDTRREVYASVGLGCHEKRHIFQMLINYIKSNVFGC